MKIPRVVRVAVLVAGLGIVGGALVGALGGLAFVLTGREWRVITEMAAGGALLGGVLGLFLGPLAGFGVLRDVPLWRAIVGTGCGALIGLWAGTALDTNFFFTALVGFAIGAGFVRKQYATNRPTLSATENAQVADGRPAVLLEAEDGPRLANRMAPPLPNEALHADGRATDGGRWRARSY